MFIVVSLYFMNRLSVTRGWHLFQLSGVFIGVEEECYKDLEIIARLDLYGLDSDFDFFAKCDIYHRPTTT